MKRALVLLVLLAGCGPAPPADPVLAPTPGLTLDLAGSGATTSAPLWLQPGPYTVAYVLTDTGGVGCVGSLGLWWAPDVPPTPPIRPLLARQAVAPGATWAATATLTVRDPNRYTLRSTGTCAFAVRFSYP